MIRSNKVQTAHAVCDGSVEPSVSGRINAINEAASRLERLSQTGNFAPLPQLVGTIARNLNRDRQGECMQEELTCLRTLIVIAVASMILGFALARLILCSRPPPIP